jgi:hypothetical protein
MEELKQFNITAQVYDLRDTSKQNLLINQVMDAVSTEDAIFQFQDQLQFQDCRIVKIHSVEQV